MIWLLVGCYDDKGNYDYKDINELEIDMLPEADTYDERLYVYRYTYRQPASEPLLVTYTPEIKQSVHGDKENNLEYEWIVAKGKERDTIVGKDVTLEFLPAVSTSYNVRLKVTDTNTGVSAYRNIQASTQVPFVKSWFVLHGKPGSRKLGAVEFPEKGADAEIALDAYAVMQGSASDTDFRNATGMLYLPMAGSDSRKPEYLSIIESDKISYMSAFDLIIDKEKNYNLVMPEPLRKQKPSYAVGNSVGGSYGILVMEDGKFVHGGANGFYYQPNTAVGLSDYKVDLMHLSASRYATVWDRGAKRFMYYPMSDNWYDPWYSGAGRPTNVSNTALLTLVPNSIFPGKVEDWAQRDVVWLGTVADPDDDYNGVLAIAKNLESDSYSVYTITYNDESSEGAITVKEHVFNHNVFKGSEKSQFATSVAFMNQIFYSDGQVVYLYNMITRENSVLYEVKPNESITKLQFCVPEYHYLVVDETRRLAVVTTDNSGERGGLYELTLNQAGDVVSDVKFDADFGPIVEIDYSFIQRLIL